MTGQEARDDEREALIEEAMRRTTDLDVTTNPPVTRAFIRRLGVALDSAHRELLAARKHPEPETDVHATCDVELGKQIDRVEELHEIADRLAYAIGGDAIGEHSSGNSPWHNALDIAARKHPEAEITADMVRRGALAMCGMDWKISMGGATTLVKAALEAALLVPVGERE